MSQDSKIGDLDSIPAPLTGSEEIVIVVGGVTYKGTVSDFKTFIVSSDLRFAVVSGGVKLKSGANTRLGEANLAAGAITVLNTTVNVQSKIFLTRKTAGGATGELTYTITPGASFTINSTSATDNSTVAYHIIDNH
jgi:hypothetical protein